MTQDDKAEKQLSTLTKNLKDRQGFQPPLTPSSSMGVSIPQMIEKIKGVVPIFSQDIYNHFNEKRTDGVYENLRFRNTAGKVLGEYGRKTGKITLYPGAKIKDVVHEFSHGLWQFAEQEAKAGRTGLRDKLHQIAKSAPDAVKDAVGRNYYDQNPNVVLEECFTHEMARRSEQNKAFARAISTARGKKWYQRAWGAIKETYAGISKKMGWDKADVGKMEKMDAHEAAEWILGQMAKGKRFGNINPEPTDRSDVGVEGSTRKSIIGEKGAKRIGIKSIGQAKKMEKSGSTREQIWESTGWWRAKDGKWRIEIPDLKINKPINEIVNQGSKGGTIDIQGGKLKLSGNGGFGGIKIEVPDTKKKNMIGNGGLKLGDVIEDVDLFTAYPRLKDIEIQFVTRPDKDNYENWGKYDSEANSITLYRVNPKNIKEVERRLTHEVQHAIQKEEELSQGKNAEDWEKYRNSLGEVEARNAQRRVSDRTKKKAPWLTEDVPVEKQIVGK